MSQQTTTTASRGTWVVGTVAALVVLPTIAAGVWELLPTAAVAAPDPAAAATPAAPTTKPAGSGKKLKGKAAEAEAFFAAGVIPQIRIELDPKDLDKLRRDGRTYVGCTVRETIPGRPEAVYKDVAIHIKGGAGSLRGIDDKPGLTLNFDKFVPDQHYHGLEKVNLNNAVQDGSYLSENLGNAIFRDAGVPACRATNARVWINNRHVGFYVLKEGFADPFLKRYFKDGSGTLYEGAFCQDINSGLTPKENEDKQDKTKVPELISAIQKEKDPAKRRERIERVLDVDRFYTFMAIEAMTSHWDGYCPKANNYRVYDDPSTGKLVFLPHGTDQLFQTPDYPLFHGNAMVAQALLATPEDKQRYLDRVAELRATVFDPDRLCQRVDEIAARTVPAMREISPDHAKSHENEARNFKARIVSRVKVIDRQLQGAPKPLKFDGAGVAALPSGTSKWELKVEGGDAKLEQVQQDGKPALRLRGGDGKGACAASFRQSVLLAQGKYVFEAQVRTANVKADPGTPNGGAGLRISGGTRDKGLTGTTPGWQRVEFPIDVTDATREVVLVCELRASAGEAFFDPASLRLRKR